VTESEETREQIRHLLGVVASELKRIADRLDAWDTIYRTREGREIHSLRETTTMFDQTKRP